MPTPLHAYHILLSPGEGSTEICEKYFLIRDLAHVMLTASATIDNDAVQMEENEGSDNAMVPVTVINTRGPELPKTGDDGVWRYGVYGILPMTAAACLIVLAIRKKKPSKR